MSLVRFLVQLCARKGRRLLAKFNFQSVCTLVILLGMLAFQSERSQAGGVHYLFHGHFAPSDRPATPEAIYPSPSVLMGQEFSIEITWPTSAGAYSADWQTGTTEWGTYWTEAISVKIDVPGFDFSAPPVTYQWDTFNDTVLYYEQGVPQSWGDELRLTGGMDWNHQTIEDSALTPQFLFLLHAADYSGSIFDDDSLQSNFDLTQFAEVWFEFRQIVAVSGSDPRPITFHHWLGVVDSMAVVPEPSSFWLAIVAFAGIAFFQCTSRRIASKAC